MDIQRAKNYSVANVANAAGFYNDLWLDHFASLDHDRNNNVNFVHAAPGFVNTNWGTELSAPLRLFVRLLQPSSLVHFNQLCRSNSDIYSKLLGVPIIFGKTYSSCSFDSFETTSSFENIWENRFETTTSFDNIWETTASSFGNIWETTASSFDNIWETTASTY